MNTLSIIGSICSIVGLLVAVFLTTKVISIKNQLQDSSSNKVKQKGNVVHTGDMAGRDITKN